MIHIQDGNLTVPVYIAAPKRICAKAALQGVYTPLSAPVGSMYPATATAASRSVHRAQRSAHAGSRRITSRTPLPTTEQSRSELLYSPVFQPLVSLPVLQNKVIPELPDAPCVRLSGLYGACGGENCGVSIFRVCKSRRMSQNQKMTGVAAENFFVSGGIFFMR